MKYLYLCLVAIVTSGCANSTYYYQGGEKKSLTPIPTQERSNQNIDFYKTQDDEKVGVSDTLMVKFYSTRNLDYYIDMYDLQIVNKITQDIYVFRVKSKSLTIQTANSLSEKKDVKFAQPDFLRKRVNR